MGYETELKFTGPEDALARLRRAPALRKLAGKRRPRTALLNGVYYDTEDFSLRDAGYVLRVRGQGRRFEQTIKSADGASIATRLEVNVAVPSQAPDIEAIPDEDLKRRIAKLVDGRPLKPMFAVDVRRTVMLLAPRRGQLLEAAFDVGEIRNGKARAPVSEFELELVTGDATALIECARTLTAGSPLTLSLQSKSERGFGLAARAPSAVAAGSVLLPAGATVDEAFAGIVSHCVSHLLGNWTAVTNERDPEGVHQMRVALRRLRSALALFGDPYRAALQEIEGEVRWIAGVMGAARDLDVFQDEVLKPVTAAHGQDERVEALTALVRLRRRKAWGAALEALQSERFRKLALDLVGATMTRPWAGSAEASSAAARFAQARLDHAYARALKAGRKLRALDEAGRHRLRIKLKKLRYAVEFFASLTPARKTAKFLERLSALQDVLGVMNDAAAARALTRDLVKENGKDSPVTYAAGVVVGWHVGHARGREKQLKRRWAEFLRVRAPWR